MKFTELSAYTLPSGLVTEWAPNTDVGALGWRSDNRPLTDDHELHIVRSARGGADSSWLGAVFSIDRRFDSEALRRAIQTWALRHETFRTTVTLGDDGSGHTCLHRRTHTGDGLTVGDSTLGRMSGQQAGEFLAEHFSTRLSPLTWPHFMIATITEHTPADDDFTLIFAADHSVMDAYSMLLSINEIRLLYEAAMAGADVDLPEIGSHVDFSAGSRSASAELTTDHPAVELWRHFLDQSGGNFPEFGLPLNEPPSTTESVPEAAPAGPTPLPQRGWAETVATAEQIAALNALSRSAGHGAQTAVVAALALANRELTGSQRLRMAMPMHTRTEARFLESVGWYVGLGALEVDLAGAQTFAEALTAAADGIAEAKRLSRLPFPRIAQLLESHAEPQFVVSYLDLRFVPGATEWSDWQAQTLRGSSHSDSEVYLWVARTPDGVTVSARYPDNTIAEANVIRLISTAFSLTTAVIEGGLEASLDSDSLKSPRSDNPQAEELESSQPREAVS